MTRVAINGFGRIGRAFFKLALNSKDIDVVAINDLGDIENLAYLLRHDSVYRTDGLDVRTKTGGQPTLVVNGHESAFISIPDPAQLPWRAMQVDVVVEATGFFASFEKSQAHITAGAKRVVITAPTKDAGGETVLMGVNDSALKTCRLSSNGSCTTNASSPVLAVLDEALGIEHALLNTVHGYTVSQSLVDGPSKKDWRRGRAGAQNIVPSSTGAAGTVAKALPTLLNKFDGIALRVPVITGSIADLTFVAKRPTSVEEVNSILTNASEDPRWSAILKVTNEPIVSSDIIGDTHASIVDASLTRVVGGTLVKVLAWYDNEMGYAATLVQHVIQAGAYL